MFWRILALLRENKFVEEAVVFIGGNSRRRCDRLVRYLGRHGDTIDGLRDLITTIKQTDQRRTK